MRLFNQVFGLKSSSFVDCEKVVTKRLKIKTSVELGLSQKIKTGRKAFVDCSPRKGKRCFSRKICTREGSREINTGVHWQKVWHYARAREADRKLRHSQHQKG